MRHRHVASWLGALFLLTGCGDGPSRDATPSATVVVDQFTPVGVVDRQALRAKGERVATVLGCRGCHGKNLQGKKWDKVPDGSLLYASNLTLLQEYSERELEHAIRKGVRPDGSPLWIMPSENFIHLSAPDMSALIAYLRTVPPGGKSQPRPVIGPKTQAEIESGEIENAAQLVSRLGKTLPVDLGPRHATARYIASVTCAECHGPDLKGGGGGNPDLIVAGTYSADQFTHLLRTGEPTGGRKLDLMKKVSINRFSKLTDAEVAAIYDYLTARAELPQ